MVLLRSIPAKTFRDNGFASKKEALHLIEAHGKNGRHFNTVQEVLDFLKQAVVISANALAGKGAPPEPPEYNWQRDRALHTRDGVWPVFERKDSGTIQRAYFRDNKRLTEWADI